MENLDEPNVPVVKQEAPNSSSALILGILSLLMPGFVGFVLSIVGICVSNAGLRKYKESPDMYFGYGNLNSGRIMSIIALIYHILVIVFCVVIIVLIFTAGFSLWPWITDGLNGCC